MKLGLQDCEKYVNVVKSHLDSSWLQNELEKIQNHKQKHFQLNFENRFHPLALRIKLADGHFDICKKDRKRNVTEEILRLALLGINIEFLETKNVKGLNFELKKLQSENHTQIEKTIYEIIIAKLFSENRRAVEFIDPEITNHGTHDLLVDDSIEVECKKKDPLIDKDIKIENTWAVTAEKLANLTEKNGSNYFIVIRTFPEPTNEIMKTIIEKISSLIQNKNVKKIKTNQAEFQVFQISKPSTDLETNIEPRVMESRDISPLQESIKELIRNRTGFNEFPDLTKFENRLLTFNFTPYKKDEKIFLKNFNAFYFNTNDPKKRITSIIHSLKQAKEQITRKRSAIIAIDMSIMSSNWAQEDLTKLNHLITNYLRNNSSVSAVLLTREWFPEDDEKISYYFEPVFIINPKARIPLPENFTI